MAIIFPFALNDAKITINKINRLCVKGLFFKFCPWSGVKKASTARENDLSYKISM